MPTTDERLRALEEFRTETLHAYTDMAYKMTMLQGLVEDGIKRQAAFRNEMNEFRAEMTEFRTRLDARIDNIVATQALILQRLSEKQ